MEGCADCMGTGEIIGMDGESRGDCTTCGGSGILAVCGG